MRPLYRFNVIILLLTAVITFSASPVLCTEASLETSMEEFVKQVIRDNPDLIVKTLNTYIKEQKALQQETQSGDRFLNRLEDSIGPQNPSRGPAEAPITIITYSEFQCPYCKKAAKTMVQVMNKYPDQVRIVFKNMPLSFHENAVPAAYAAMAAMQQGKFWEYYDALFTDGTALKEESYRNIALTLGLDLDKFDADRQSAEVAKQVQTELERAKELNLNSTPSFLINGVLVQGARPLDYFSKIINRLLEEENNPVRKAS